MYVAKLGDYYISDFDLNLGDGNIFSINLTKSLHRASFFNYKNLRGKARSEILKIGAKFYTIEECEVK